MGKKQQGDTPIVQIDSIEVIYSCQKLRDVQRFVVSVKFYRDMWHNHAHTLSTLTKLCTTEVKFEWTELEQKPFVDTEIILGRDFLLSYNL